MGAFNHLYISTLILLANIQTMKNAREHQPQSSNKCIFAFPIKMYDIIYNHIVSTLGYI